jgi:hypothetical protein
MQGEARGSRQQAAHPRPGTKQSNARGRERGDVTDGARRSGGVAAGCPRLVRAAVQLRAPPAHTKHARAECTRRGCSGGRSWREGCAQPQRAALCQRGCLRCRRHRKAKECSLFFLHSSPHLVITNGLHVGNSSRVAHHRTHTVTQSRTVAHSCTQSHTDTPEPKTTHGPKRVCNTQHPQRTPRAHAGRTKRAHTVHTRTHSIHSAHATTGTRRTQEEHTQCT